MSEIAHSILPASVQSTGLLVNGKTAVQANLFQVDFIKPNFDRRRTTMPSGALHKGDPPVDLAFDVMNNWINR